MPTPSTKSWWNFGLNHHIESFLDCLCIELWPLFGLSHRIQCRCLQTDSAAISDRTIASRASWLCVHRTMAIFLFIAETHAIACWCLETVYAAISYWMIKSKASLTFCASSYGRFFCLLKKFKESHEDAYKRIVLQFLIEWSHRELPWCPAGRAMCFCFWPTHPQTKQQAKLLHQGPRTSMMMCFFFFVIGLWLWLADVRPNLLLQKPMPERHLYRSLCRNDTFTESVLEQHL